MKWIKPHIIKIYEAFGALADNRITIVKQNKDYIEAQIFSSSRKKNYIVKYDYKKQIMANDNGSYFVGYLGYPSIALLVLYGKIQRNNTIISKFSDIKWKDINVKNDNNFDVSCKEILDIFVKQGGNSEKLEKYTQEIFLNIKSLNLEYFGEKIEPPKGY